MVYVLHARGALGCRIALGLLYVVAGWLLIWEGALRLRAYMDDGWLMDGCLDPFGAQHGSQMRLNAFLGRLGGPVGPQKGSEGGPGPHFDAFGVPFWSIWILCWPI